MKVAPARIRETKRIIDDLVTPEQFSTIPGVDCLGDPQQWETLRISKSFFASWQSRAHFRTEPRQEVPLPEVEVQYFPSNPRGHVVVRDTPMEAWKEVFICLPASAAG